MTFFSVRTSTIRPDAPLLFDLYVHFQDQYLKYLGVNDVIQGEKLAKFKNKKIKKVFIPAEQEPKYLTYLDQALEQLQKKDLAVAERAEFAQDTLKREAETIDQALESEEAYKSSEARLQKVVDFMINEPKALADMLASAGLSVDDSQHGSTVSSLCLGVGSASGELDRDALTDLAVASLLHDGSLKILGFDAKTDYAALGKDEKPKYRTHPAKSVELVAGKRFITPRVLRLIEDHEEYGAGLGFPNKKNYAKLGLDSRIFNLCDAFDHFSIRLGKPPHEAMEPFIESRADHFDMDLVQILEKKVKT